MGTCSEAPKLSIDDGKAYRVKASLRCRIHKHRSYPSYATPNAQSWVPLSDLPRKYDSLKDIEGVCGETRYWHHNADDLNLHSRGRPKKTAHLGAQCLGHTVAERPFALAALDNNPQHVRD